MQKRLGRLLVSVTFLMFGPVSFGRADVRPGDTITKTNMAQAAELLTPSTRWMLERGMTMWIGEPQPYTWPKAYQDATERYAGQVVISADGREIANYIAGAPFPVIAAQDHLAGYKIMWNHAQPPYSIDNIGASYVAHLVNSQGNVDQSFENSWRRVMWTGRLYTDPKPIIPHNPAVRHSHMWGPLVLPNRYKGLAVLEFRYIPASAADDTYVYSPQLRRVRRISVADRSASIWGSDYDLDSFYGFNAKIGSWDFRLLAEKDILGVLHSGRYGDPAEWCGQRDTGQGLRAALPCVTWEKRRVWVVEVRPLNSPRKYAYSKRVLYVDQETFGVGIAELYDTNGELQKGLVHCAFVTKKPHAGYPSNPLSGARYNYQEEQLFVPNFVMIDFQKMLATVGEIPSTQQPPSEWQGEPYFNEAGVRGADPDSHTTNALMEMGR